MVAGEVFIGDEVEVELVIMKVGSRSIRVTGLEEPDAVTPHVRSCEGEIQQWMNYSTGPRHLSFSSLNLS